MLIECLLFDSKCTRAVQRLIRHWAWASLMDHQAGATTRLQTVAYLCYFVTTTNTRQADAKHEMWLNANSPMTGKLNELRECCSKWVV